MVNKQLPSSFQFEAIFNEAAIGILVTNASFEILISNYFADRLFGFEHDELKTLFDYIEQGFILMGCCFLFLMNCRPRYPSDHSSIYLKKRSIYPEKS